ncbi:MAG: ATP-binding cassette domain-containing protein [Leptospirales bacterium]|nr:ATP-binding cassette domain-containing protein [Leptospirales bacterium]
MIKLENVSLDIFGSNRRILSCIDWEICSGESWILFGRNGSGKTKLLEIITGYIFPSEGSVRRFGYGHLESDIREIRKRIGYLSSVLREKFNREEKVIDTVLSGIYASVGLYREPSTDEIKRGLDLLREAGLADREDDIIGHLSDGEKQKVFMLRALINNPDILILDEPSVGLDICAREDFLESLKKLMNVMNVMNERKHSLIYVTHHVEEITPIFGKIFIIEDGKCFFNGSVDDAVSKNIFTSLFKRDIEIFKKGERLYSSLGM